MLDARMPADTRTRTSFASMGRITRSFRFSGADEVANNTQAFKKLAAFIPTACDSQTFEIASILHNCATGQLLWVDIFPAERLSRG